jgi:DNA-binding CsgD family transcriptional regulator
MSQLMIEKPTPAHERSENTMINQPKEGQNGVFSNEICTYSAAKNTQKRQLKPKTGPKYRKINQYFKSRGQYQKERQRRKRVRELSAEGFTYPQIAKKLGVSEKTVYRDMQKLWPYILGEARKEWRRFDQDLQLKFQAELEGKSLWQQFMVLSRRMDLLKQQFKPYYRGHYTILLLDLTDTDKYGIPKLTQLPKQTQGATLAYPYKIRVRVRGEYEGHMFEADIGGFNIVQTTRGLW